MKIEFLESLDPRESCSRRHALKIFAACAGITLVGPHIRTAHAEPPWGETSPANLLDQSPGERYGRKPHQSHPTLVTDSSGTTLWTSWTQLHDQREAALLRSFSIADQAWSEPLLLSDQSTPPMGAYESELVNVGTNLLAVWSACAAGSWGLWTRVVDTATRQLGPAHPLVQPTEPEAHLHPALAADEEQVLCVWQARPHDQQAFSVLGRFLDSAGTPLGEPFVIAGDQQRDCTRPAVVALGKARGFAVAYAQQDQPGTQNIYLALVTRDGTQSTRQISWHPASDVAPALAISPASDLVWVAWHSNRRGDNDWDIIPWYRLAAWRPADDSLWQPAQSPAPANPDPRGTLQGFELVRLITNAAGGLIVLGRASHNFYIQAHGPKGPQSLHRLPKDGWGGRGRLLRGTFAGDGGLWVTRRDLGWNVLARVDGFADCATPPPLERINPPTTTTPPTLARCTPRYTWPESKTRPDDLNLYFGDIHGHSYQSDGMGDPEASYLRARDVLRDDFHVLTDHDDFVGKRLNDTQWEEQKLLADHYHREGEFATLFGQEWTTARVGRPHGWGHFNIYTDDPRLRLLAHTDDDWQDLDQIYAELRKYNAIAIPHHIGWTGVPWDAIDPQLTPVVEICSVHGAFEYEGNEPLRHRGCMPGCFYRDGLARGLPIGVVGGSDQHGLAWHHGMCWKRNCFRAGLTGIWAPELTRTALLDALRQRRTFATTGVKLQLLFTVDDELMGGTVAASGPPRISFDVAVPPDQGLIRWLQVVRNGQVIQNYGGTAQRDRFSFRDDECPIGQTSAYYLRVVLADNNMAWSSPVWVERQA